MFLGHYAAALAAKKFAPRTSLGTLSAAAVFLDLLWPLFLLVGWETVAIDPGNTPVAPLDFVRYPISHSLLSSIGWALLFAATYLAVRGYRRGALVCALAVISHWGLDFLSHRPDLPLTPFGGPKVGLGLWYSLGGTIVVETALLVFGIWIYRRSTAPRDRFGSWGLAGFVTILLLIFAANVFGPPPPDVRVLPWAGFAQGGLVLFAWWLDRHRQSFEE